VIFCGREAMTSRRSQGSGDRNLRILLQPPQFEHYQSEGLVMRYLCFFVALALVPLSRVNAQEDQLLEPGDRVRVSTAPVGSRSAWMVGSVIAATGAHLTIRPERDSAQEIGIPRTTITRMEVSRGQKSRWLAGLGLGFLGGAAAGAAVGYHLGSGSSGDLFGPEASAIIVAIPGALGGALIGVVIGSVIKVDRWQVVPRVTVGRLDPADFHVQFLVSLRSGS
jgi:hypothetical protein